MLHTHDILAQYGNTNLGSSELEGFTIDARREFKNLRHTIRIIHGSYCQ